MNGTFMAGVYRRALGDALGTVDVYVGMAWVPTPYMQAFERVYNELREPAYGVTYNEASLVSNIADMFREASAGNINWYHGTLDGLFRLAKRLLKERQ
jgi:hypothetical protein